MNSCRKFSTGRICFALWSRLQTRQELYFPRPHTFPALRDGPLSEVKSPEPE
jgi:hypothetical protein